MRDNVILQCPECKRRNYATTKNKMRTTSSAVPGLQAAATTPRTKNKKKTTERLELTQVLQLAAASTRPHKETK